MGHRSDRDGLRGSLYAVDLPALMDALNDAAWPAGSRCAVALRNRGWEGDDELANQIDAILGVWPTPLLKSLEVDLEELEGDPVMGGGRVDLRSGEVWPQSAIEYFEEVGELDPDDDDDQRWLDVPVAVAPRDVSEWVELLELLSTRLAQGRIYKRDLPSLVPAITHLLDVT